jgi:hypothetical protein
LREIFSVFAADTSFWVLVGHFVAPCVKAEPGIQ